MADRGENVRRGKCEIRSNEGKKAVLSHMTASSHYRGVMGDLTLVRIDPWLFRSQLQIFQVGLGSAC